MIDRNPEEWFDRFDAVLAGRRARRFPVASGRAWRLGRFVVHVEIEGKTPSAIAIAAAERLGEDGTFDSATATEEICLNLDGDGDASEAARRVVNQLLVL